jgi:hypothetical protein
MWHVLFVFCSALQGFCQCSSSYVFHMSVFSGDVSSILECAARGPGSAAEFRRGVGGVA